MSQSRPNVLFLMSDEHRADVTGYEGNEVVRTPFLDELAATGVVFRNCYCASPICIPSRQAMMAGLYPRSCDCEIFGDDLAPGTMTFARRFSQYAYQTVCCGKLHHVGQDQMQGWLARPAGDLHVTPRYVEGYLPEEADRYKAAAGIAGWTVDKEIARAGVGRSPHQEDDELAFASALQVASQHFADPYYDRTSARPLLLKFSTKLPHYPFQCDEDRFTYYLNRVPIFGADEPDPLGITPDWGIPKGPNPRDARRATAAYYGLVETIDDWYGQLADHLEHLGQDLDDWIVIYTSDHGDMIGQHGCWWKNSFYDGSARVPLIIRWPKRFAPRVVTENVNQIDLFATLCDLVGIPTPEGLESRSLVPLMGGDASGWDNETLSQFWGKDLMIRRDNWKYCDVHQYAGHREALFDMAVDPGETTNLIDRPEHAPAVAAFRARRDELGFGRG